MNSAIIFDVDGVLLELTHEEEELFFVPFAKRIDATKLSRDWNSYKIRNDEEIVSEIVLSHGLPQQEAATITREYLSGLEHALHKDLKPSPIEGAAKLLNTFAPHTRLGIATANFRLAAEMRLRQAHMWEPVATLAFGAEGGGHKSVILSRAIAASGLPRENIIFIGDNVSDVVAGLENQVQFIGFSTSACRLVQLRAAGAQILCAAHDETEKKVRQLLNAAI
ncbi:MAG: HAD hydrolase-like protein [Pseudomonadota bacterium]|nr:HAD hydrolase-like protein [Pseudomonadota bacterium]